MKARKQNVVFDGVGYVNNRGGFSRYWGVSFYFKDRHARNMNQKSIRVIVTDCDGKKYDFKSNGFEMTHEQSALVASYFYERIQGYLSNKGRDPFDQVKHFIRNKAGNLRVMVSLATKEIQLASPSMNNTFYIVNGGYAPFAKKVGADEADSIGVSGKGVITLDSMMNSKPVLPQISSRAVVPGRINTFTYDQECIMNNALNALQNALKHPSPAVRTELRLRIADLMTQYPEDIQ